MSEAIGKILGMAMAYGVSSLGLWLAYVNYRKRIVKADRVMTPVAWAVVAAVVSSVVLGSLVVARLTPPQDPAAVLEASAPPEGPPAARGGPADREAPRQRWSWVGVAVPAAIFLFATWITATLHRRFSTGGPGSLTRR